jgi:hypothetical protein
MGVEEVKRALALARTKEGADIGSGVSDQAIAAAEDYLGIRFPTSYREFVSAVGWCSIGGRDFYGITRDGVAATSIPSVVFATRSEREDGGLPAGLLFVEDSGADEKFVLDTRELNAEGDAPVKAWTPASDPGSLEIVAPDFGSYLLKAATRLSA